MATHDAQGNELILCSRCKCRRLVSEFELDRHGHKRKSCVHCKQKRTQQTCEHKKRRERCAECGGSEICEHKTRRERCIECGGTAMCEHKRQRPTCLECKGSQVCEHKKQRSSCLVCSPLSHLEGIVRRRVHKILGSDKKGSPTEYLACDIKTYHTHIENSFQEGMSWANYGTYSPEIKRWQIDHIIPIKAKLNGVKPTIDEIAQRFHWQNTHAMWATDNMRKGSKIVAVVPDESD